MDINELQKAVIEFRDARDWKQFHTPKDSAISLALEASEYLEHFQWKSPLEIEALLQDTDKFQELKNELVDVLYWVLLIGNDLEIDIPTEFMAKLQKNGEKYPVNKAKGRHTKYTEL